MNNSLQEVGLDVTIFKIDLNKKEMINLSELVSPYTSSPLNLIEVRATENVQFYLDNSTVTTSVIVTTQNTGVFIVNINFGTVDPFK